MSPQNLNVNAKREKLLNLQFAQQTRAINENKGAVTVDMIADVRHWVSSLETFIPLQISLFYPYMASLYYKDTCFAVTCQNFQSELHWTKHVNEDIVFLIYF